MEPKILEKDEIILIGFSFFGDPFQLSDDWTSENEIGRLWKRFFSYLGTHKSSLKHIVDPNVAYEVHIVHKETPTTGNMDIFVGLEVKTLEDIPPRVLVKILPATKYAVFTLVGQEITSDWGWTIYREWLPASGYQESFPFSFQYYDQRFKGLDNIKESVLDVYIPIKDR